MNQKSKSLTIYEHCRDLFLQGNRNRDIRYSIQKYYDENFADLDEPYSGVIRLMGEKDATALGKVLTGRLMSLGSNGTTFTVKSLEEEMIDLVYGFKNCGQVSQYLTFFKEVGVVQNIGSSANPLYKADDVKLLSIFNDPFEFLFSYRHAANEYVYKLAKDALREGRDPMKTPKS